MWRSRRGTQLCVQPSRLQRASSVFTSLQSCNFKVAFPSLAGWQPIHEFLGLVVEKPKGKPKMNCMKFSCQCGHGFQKQSTKQKKVETDWCVLHPGAKLSRWWKQTWLYFILCGEGDSSVSLKSREIPLRWTAPSIHHPASFLFMAPLPTTVCSWPYVTLCDEWRKKKLLRLHLCRREGRGNKQSSAVRLQFLKWPLEADSKSETKTTDNHNEIPNFTASSRPGRTKQALALTSVVWVVWV